MTRVAAALLVLAFLSPVARAGLIESVAGGGAGDGLAAVEQGLEPVGVATNLSGDPLIVDRTHGRIRQVDLATGLIATVAGRGWIVGVSGYDLQTDCGPSWGDGGPATAACLSPVAVARDAAGNLFIADVRRHAGDGVIRRVDAATGTISTVAGGSTSCAPDRGDGGPAIVACLAPTAVAVDAGGNLFVVDISEPCGGGSVRRVDAATGVISTIATGRPKGVGVDAGGNVFIADTTSLSIQPPGFCSPAGGQIARVDGVSGVRSTIAGNGTGACAPGDGDGGPASAACMNPLGIAVEATGSVVVAGNARVRRVDAATGVIAPLAGAPPPCGPDGSPATAACLGRPTHLAIDAAGNVLIVDADQLRVRRVVASTGLISTVAGNGTMALCGEGGPATNAGLGFLSSVAADAAGNLFVSELSERRVRRVDAVTGTITTAAGSGAGSNPFCYPSNGDGGPASAACFVGPKGVAVDGDGNLYVADESRVRRVDALTGVITTFAGSATPGYCGDGGPATAACLGSPSGIGFDPAGNLLITDSFGNRVRRVEAATGVISTVAGGGTFGNLGDGGPATAAYVGSPIAVAVDAGGNLFIAENFNSYRIRRVDAATGIITTVAGNGTLGFCGDGGPATAACFGDPTGVAVDGAGNLFIADQNNSHRLRRVDGATGVITTIAGGVPCGPRNGDGGVASGACMSPGAVAFDPAGRLLVADNLGFGLSHSDVLARVRRICDDADQSAACRILCADADHDGLCNDNDLDDLSGLLLERVRVRGAIGGPPNGSVKVHASFSAAAFPPAPASFMTQARETGFGVTLYATASRPSPGDLPLVSLSMAPSDCTFRDGGQRARCKRGGATLVVRPGYGADTLRVTGVLRLALVFPPAAGPLWLVVNARDPSALDYVDGLSAGECRAGSSSRPTLRCAR